MGSACAWAIACAENLLSLHGRTEKSRDWGNAQSWISKGNRLMFICSLCFSPLKARVKFYGLDKLNRTSHIISWSELKYNVEKFAKESIILKHIKLGLLENIWLNILVEKVWDTTQTWDNPKNITRTRDVGSNLWWLCDLFVNKYTGLIFSNTPGGMMQPVFLRVILSACLNSASMH